MAITANNSAGVTQIAFSPNSELLAAVGVKGGVRLWNIRSLRNPMVLAAGKGGAAGLSFNPNGKILATASTSGTIKFWNPSNGRPAEAPLTTTNQGISTIAYSPSSSIIAIARPDGTIQLWNPSTRTQIASFSAGASMYTAGFQVVIAMAFNPAGTLLATANADGTARLWNLATYQQVGGPLTADSSTVRTVTFSRNGETLVTAGDDGKAIFWGIAFPPDPQGLLCQIAGRSLGRAEWATYAPAETYRKVCLSLPVVFRTFLVLAASRVQAERGQASAPDLGSAERRRHLPTGSPEASDKPSDYGFRHQPAERDTPGYPHRSNLR
jgi:hypothetical protein